MLSLETKELGKASIPFLLYPASLLATEETIYRVDQNNFDGDLYELNGVMTLGGPLEIYDPCRLRFSKPFHISKFTALVFQLKMKANASQTARRMRISVAPQSVTNFNNYKYAGSEAIRQTKILGGGDYWSFTANTIIDLNIYILKLLNEINYGDDDYYNILISFDGAPLEWAYIEKCNVIGSGVVPEGFYA